MANFWYNTGKLRMWAGATGLVDLIADTIKVMALQGDTGESTDHEFIGDVITAGAVEVTSVGYIGGYGGAGRKVLGGKALSVDQVNDRAEFDCGDVTWTAISQAGSELWVALLIVREVTSDALSPVLAHIDTATGLPLTPNGSDISLAIDAEGLLHIT